MQHNPFEAIQYLEYNSLRTKLILPEYGRHFQKFIDIIKRIENKEERNKAARYAIKIMGDMNPHLRDVPDFQHKLWDQLFIMADFELDVDSPYPIKNAENVKITPITLPYPQKKPKYRFYGNNIKAMIDQAIEWEDGEKKDGLILAIANHMKKCYLNWNKDTVDDEVIFNHLFELSNGKLNLKEASQALSSTQNLIRVTKKQSNKASFTPNPSNASQQANRNATTNQNQNNNRRFMKNGNGNTSHTNNNKNNSNQNNKKS